MSDNKQNTGNSNTGYWNAGNRNTGDSNTGYGNTGNRNTGNRNTGYGNTGNRNTGYWNAGDSNAGDRNTGNRNTGNRNTGYWNSCNHETGMFNTENSDIIRVFNMPCSREDWSNSKKPDFLYFKLNEWIAESEMTDDEKVTVPKFYVTGGYLKSYEYKEEFRKSWDNADAEDRAKLFELPNFDAKVFEEISGIDVSGYVEPSCEGKTIVIDGVEYELREKK